MDELQDRTAGALLPGGGEMGARIRAFDWAATSLGPVAAWPASLRTIVSVVYLSGHPMFLFWGPEHVGLYNDAYRQSLGPDRHPSALGRPGRETWDEIWPTIGPQIEAVMTRSEATWHADQYLPITRGDRVEDVYWSYSYSPVPDDAGAVGGVLVTVQETTRRVFAERRLRVLQELTDREIEAATPDHACTIAAAVLSAHPDDLPCALIYLNEAGGVLRLGATIGLEPGSAAAPKALDDPDAHRAVLARACSGAAGETAVVPLATAPGLESAGVLIAGTNPRIPFDDDYRAFLAQIAREIAGSIQTVRAREERHRTLTEAAGAERVMLARVFELSPSFLAVLRGPEHVFELINPAYTQLIGHRDIIGKRVVDALPEVVEQGFVDLLDRVYRTGVPFVGNELLVAVQTEPGAPRQERYLNFVYQPMRNVDGAVTGIHVNGVDVTELVRQRQLVEREAAEHDAERRQLLTVLEQSPLGILIFDPDSRRVLFSNVALRRTLGYSDDELPGDFDALSADWRQLKADGQPVAPADRPITRALMQAAPVTNELLHIEHVPTGRRLEIAETAAPVRDAHGRIIAAVIILADVTAERRTERQLRDAERMQAVGTLAGGVAHEINNQMTAVLGFGSFVLRALGPEHAQAPDMRLVLQSAERAARISQQLLAFTRQQVTRREVLDLAALVTELEPVLAQLLGSDKTLTIAPAGGATPVYADPDQVQQVMINLVANARDATETAGRVTIGIEPVAVPTELPAPSGEAVQPGRYVRVTVADTGNGMPREVLTRIFDPFFTTKPVGKGSGLGLPMVYGTMRRHGGYVLAHSAPGAGTTLELYWPLASVAPPPDSVKRREPTRRRVADRAGAVVLVAEDEPVVRSLAVRTLEAEGYKVVATADGAAAADLLRSGRLSPDLVITDVIMPRLNGRQLSDAVHEQFPEVPVIFMSGHTGEDAVLQRLIPAGAPFLRKPFTPGELARVAAEALEPAARR